MRENFGGKSISPLNRYPRDLKRKIQDSRLTWPSYAKRHNRNILHHPPCSLKTSCMRFNSSRRGWNFDEGGERKVWNKSWWVLGYAAPQTILMNYLLTSPGRAYNKQQTAWPCRKREEGTSTRWLDESNNCKWIFVVPAWRTSSR